MFSTKASFVLMVILAVCFAATICFAISVPFMIDWYLYVTFDSYWIRPDYRTFITVFLELLSVCAMVILAELVLMLKTVTDDPFVAKNVRALKRMGYEALAAAAIFFGKCIFFATPLTLVCGFLLVICALCAFVLSGLFRQAVAFKEENALTI